MTNTDGLVPDDHHVARHVRGTLVHGNSVDPEAFYRVQGDDGLSVSWMEYWGGDRKAQMTAVREHCGLALRNTHRFAVLGVLRAKDALAAFPLGIDFVPFPEAPGGSFPGNPSHCLTRGFPAVESEDHFTAAARLALAVDHPLELAIAG